VLQELPTLQGQAGLGLLDPEEGALRSSETSVKISQSQMVKQPTTPESSFTIACFTLGHKTWASNLFMEKSHTHYCELVREAHVKK
jgi:hypothetical protein